MNVKFTIDVEKEKQLSFLDVMKKRKTDCSICHHVKKTNAHRYLNGTSHHHPAHTSSELNTLNNISIHISCENS